MRISIFYFAFFAFVGVFLPFFSPYLRGLGFDGKEIAVVSSLPYLLMMVAPPLWGFLADRTRRPTVLLKVAAAGAALSLAPLLAVRSVWAVAVVIAVHGVFQTSISSLADPIALAEARRIGVDFPRLRLWGSVGFVVAVTLFGAHLDHGGELRDVVIFGVGLALVHSLVALTLRPAGVGVPAPRVRDAVQLAADPVFFLFLVAASLHWAGLSPFHLLFAVHVEDLGLSPQVVGVGFGLAVSAEVVVMWQFRRLRGRVPLFAILAGSFIASALRWYAVSQTDDGLWLTLIQVVHGVSFGAFYAAAIAHLERVVPDELLATGRALFAAVVFGLGGALGNAVAGITYDLGGGSLAFLGGSVFAAVAPLFLLFSWAISRSRRRSPQS